MLRLVGIFGSPRRDGNSDILLNSAIKGAESNGAVVEKIVIRDFQIAPCNSCGGCGEKGFFIATAARDTGEGLFTGAVKTIKAFFHVLDTQYMGDILCAGLEEKGVAGKKQELLQQAFDAGKKLLE